MNVDWIKLKTLSLLNHKLSKSERLSTRIVQQRQLATWTRSMRTNGSPLKIKDRDTKIFRRFPNYNIISLRGPIRVKTRPTDADPPASEGRKHCPQALFSPSARVTFLQGTALLTLPLRRIFAQSCEAVMAVSLELVGLDTGITPRNSQHIFLVGIFR